MRLTFGYTYLEYRDNDYSSIKNKVSLKKLLSIIIKSEPITNILINDYLRKCKVIHLIPVPIQKLIQLWCDSDYLYVYHKRLLMTSVDVVVNNCV